MGGVSCGAYFIDLIIYIRTLRTKISLGFCEGRVEFHKKLIAFCWPIYVCLFLCTVTVLQ